MKANKNLLGTLFLAIGTVACAFGAYARNSVDLATVSAKGEPSKLDGYTAYYCSAATAKTQKMFGGADTYQTITEFLTANMANYKSGIDELIAYGVPFAGYEFAGGDYWFYLDKDPTTLDEGSYFAVVAYSSATEDIVRVFSSTATGEEGNRELVFDPKSSGYGVAGDWTTVNVPEPTSGLLLLLGVAGLALRRKR